MAFILFSLFVATVAADFTYTVFSDKHCSPGNAALAEVAETNGVCVSHDGGSAIVDCGPSGMVFNVWKWSSSSTCSGVPDVSLVAPSGSCEAFATSSLQINCKAKKLTSAGSLAQRLLAAKKVTTTSKPTTTTRKPTTTTAKPKKKAATTTTTTTKRAGAVKAVATVAPSATPSCAATVAPSQATNAQGVPIVVFPEGQSNQNGRTCGAINGPQPTSTATPTPTSHSQVYSPVATPSPTAKKTKTLFP